MEKESLFGKGFCLRSSPLLPGAFQVLLCSWPHVSGVLMPTLVGIAMGAHHTWFGPWCCKEPEIKPEKKKRGIKLPARAGALVRSSLVCGAVSPADSTAQGSSVAAPHPA